MIRKILDEIESFRGTGNPFKRGAVLLKDTIWEKIIYNPDRPETTVSWNRLWDNYSWEKNGDEWDDQAAFCNQPYEKWKISIFEAFIKPNINKEAVVLEIAPGHGRWTEFMLSTKALILVDLNKECIDYCKKRFSKCKSIRYFVNDGKDLSFIPDNSVDFVWSYDSFVHMQKDVIGSYFREFSRILTLRGRVIIHHAGGKKGGWRSKISKRTIRKLAEKNHLKVLFQTDTWGKNREYNCKAHGDYLSGLVKQA